MDIATLSQPSHHAGQMRTQALVMHPAILELLPSTAGLSCLDVGCGEGVISKFIKEQRSSWQLTVGDLPGAHLEKARHTLKDLAEVKEIDLRTRLPFGDGSQGVIVSICTFMWLNDLEFQFAAKELRRLIAADGKFILIDVHPVWQARKLDKGWPSDGKTTPVGDNWKNGAITVWWRSRETYEANLQKSGFKTRCKDIIIPAGLDLTPRYQEQVGAALYLAIEGSPA